MYAIMGATGQTGGAVLAELLARGAAVRAITRDAARARALLDSRAEIVQADAADPDGLARAFAGCAGAYVLVVPPADADDALAVARRNSQVIAGALVRAGLPRAVALSAEGAHGAEGTGIIRVLHDFEAALAASGAPVTILRATLFMESWAEVLGSARAEGVLPSLVQPLDREVRMVSVADIGRVAAGLLLAGGRPRVVNLVGPRDSAPRDVAAALARRLGRPVEAVALPRAASEPSLAAAGLAPGYAAEVAAMYDAINADAAGYEPGVGETRRGSVALEDALAALAA
jgi:uncharacterized protein YbjT (DUF2867 family)